LTASEQARAHFRIRAARTLTEAFAVTGKIFSIGFVYLIAVVGWIVLGSTITMRTDSQDVALKEKVGHLWGAQLEQRAPTAMLDFNQMLEPPEAPASPTPVKGIRLVQARTQPAPAALTQSKINVDLELDQRKKGLLWYSTYEVRFDGNYTFENQTDKAGMLTIGFSFPSAYGRYDDFLFEVDGKEVPLVRKDAQLVEATIPSGPRSRHNLVVTYASQGLDHFGYKFGEGIAEVKDFELTANTDFNGFDFTASNAMSPTSIEDRDGGAALTWKYRGLISGDKISIEMPHKVNPGPLAARISFFAPVSLGFFFFLIFVISMLRGINIHPLNYFFLAASFFAFHLLLAYLVDHISIHLAFGICSAVSIFLVVSYMRMVVSNRFAFLDTALAQFVYLIGFSYAFFVEGFTGLAVTIGAIITLFVVMQMTGRIDWTQRFALIRGDAALPPIGGSK
jgi:hypothetical protein